MSFNSFAIFFAKFIGMANPKFCESALVKVLIPITLPFESINGPPLFPGFNDASVWIILSNSFTSGSKFPLESSNLPEAESMLKSTLTALIIPADAIG